MEHNQHLNEITYLIQKYCKEKNISTSDTGKINSLFDEIRGNFDNYSRLFEKKPFIKISDITAIEYLENFQKFFHSHPQLNKNFIVRQSFFDESIKSQENIVLRLIDYNGSFELAYLINGKVFLVNDDDSPQTDIKLADFNKYKKDFDLGMGKELDDNLTNNTKTDEIQIKDENLKREKDNTRKITIFYYGNLDDVAPDEEGYFFFIPAIINDHSNLNYHQFTFLMVQLNKERALLKDIVYYDTFQLCPPTC